LDITEGRVIDEFLKRLSQGSSNISYGYLQIREIVETGAISTLIMLDTFLHGTNQVSKEEVQNLLQLIEKTRGKVVVISSRSESAARLKTFGGILALLRYELSWK